MEKPKIRFKGYQEDWEQRKLNEIADKVSEKNKNNEFSEPFTNSAEQGIISQKDYFDREIVNNENLNGYYIVRNDDFIYNPRISVTAPVGPINRNRLGRNGVMSPLYTVFRTHDIDNLYLEFYFKTTKWHRFMKLNGDSGARFDRFTISSTQFMEMPIPYPTLEEQQKIGEYFDSLDLLITLHQRKCEEMKTLKKYMLQKMFPQNGQLVPQIRFSGFTEDWEQRKLSNCAGFRRGSFPQPYGNKDWYDGEGAMPFVQVADVSDDMKLVDDTKQKISKLAQPMSVCAEEGSVLVTLQGSIGRVAITQYKAFVDRTVLIFDKYNADIDKTFWAYIIKEKFIEEARKAPGGTIKTITKEVLSDFDLMLPSYDEQKMLGKLLHSLDDLITLHQQKCDELRNIKKFMLQNMFI